MRKARAADAWVVLSTLQPGAKGTRRLAAEWGDRLYCVRYRYNAARGLRLKTVEIVVDEVAWSGKHAAGALVGVLVRSWESRLRNQIVAAGGKWNGELGLWLLTEKAAEALGVANRAKSLQTRTLGPQEANMHGGLNASKYGNLRPNASKYGGRR